MNDSRTDILSSIRTTLRSTDHKATMPALESWGAAIDDPLTRFLAEWKRNDGILLPPVADPIERSKVIAEFIQHEFGAKSVWIAEEDDCKGDWNNRFPELILGDHFDRNTISQCEVAISGCELCIGETGSIAVSSRPGRPRALSLLPPNVLFMTTKSRIVAKIDDALTRLATQAPHGWVWISGPSRTADIEKVLVKGVHGPKRVALMIFDT